MSDVCSMDSCRERRTRWARHAGRLERLWVKRALPVVALASFIAHITGGQ